MSVLGFIGTLKSLAKRYCSSSKTNRQKGTLINVIEGSSALKKMKQPSSCCCTCLIELSHHWESIRTVLTPFRTDSSTLIHHHEFSHGSNHFGTCSSENYSQSIQSIVLPPKMCKIMTGQAKHETDELVLSSALFYLETLS